MRYLSLCSGIEAASVAWHPLGWTPVAFSEIESFPSAVLAHHYPTVPNFGDLTKHAAWPLTSGSIDLIVGGTPCQSFSVAGLRKGLEDPRGNLALTFLRLADRLKPKWIVWENVPGVLSSGGGRDFGAFLGALVEFGYGFAYRVLDAQHFGVPQRRRRVFVVAYLGDWEPAAEVLSLGEGLRGHIEKSGKKRKAIAPSAGSGSNADSRAAISFQPGNLARRARANPSTELFPTLTKFSGDQSLHIACATPFRKSKRDTRTTHAVLQPIVIDRAAFNQGQNAQYNIEIGEAEIMPSLVARGPHAVGLVIPIQDGRELDKGQNGLGVGGEGDPCYTLDTTGAASVATAMTVRRLTPIECERLQGFPDDWTAITYRGKPAADGPRYKAIGNSMAVPVMRWIGERIAAVDKVTR